MATDELLDAPLWMVGASLRLHKALQNEGCKTLRDALALRMDRFAKVPNIGKASVAELEHLLSGGDPLPLPKAQQELEARAIEALQLRDEGGLTYRQIADKFGARHTETARQWVAKGDRIKRLREAERSIRRR